MEQATEDAAQVVVDDADAAADAVENAAEKAQEEIKK